MVLKSPQVIVQSGLWKTYMNTAAEAYNQGRYTDAEEPLKAALKEVQRLGQDSPLGTTLNKLALLYHAQGMYAEAEPLYKRSLAIREALGSEHSNLAQGLDNYAALLQTTNREDQAAKLRARARAIRSKHARENPPK
jgi:tetratricopeptide (TPR) repeat protein